MSCALTYLKAEAVRVLGRRDVVPGMIAAIQSHGQLLHGNPNIHVLITDSDWTHKGEFRELPEFDMKRLLVARQDAIFELYLAKEKIVPEVAENMPTLPHCGFSVDQSVFLPAGDLAGIESRNQFMASCPFSLYRLVKVSDTGQFVHEAEKLAFRHFPDPKGDGIRAGVPQAINYQLPTIVIQKWD